VRGGGEAEKSQQLALCFVLNMRGKIIYALQTRKRVRPRLVFYCLMFRLIIVGFFSLRTEKKEFLESLTRRNSFRAQPAITTTLIELSHHVLELLLPLSLINYSFAFPQSLRSFII
jgi:hypothetical protein